MIEAGTVASTLLLGVDHGADAMLRPLGEAVAAGRPEDAMPGLIWVLVAEGRDGSLNGVLLAVPPTNVLTDGLQGGVPVPHLPAAGFPAGLRSVFPIRKAAVASAASAHVSVTSPVNSSHAK